MRKYPAKEELVTANIYNLTLGLCVLYGIVLNIVTVCMFAPYVQHINLTAFLIVYFIVGFTGIWINKNYDKPFISMIGYTMLVMPIGVLLAIALPGYPVLDILHASVVTAAIVVIMIVVSTTKPDVFYDLGPVLSIGLISGIVLEIISILFGYTGKLFDWLFVLLFSGYIGYDWVKAQSVPYTIDNAIDSALDIYLDVINLFLRILEISSKSKKRK